jgi:hypothetical protein
MTDKTVSAFKAFGPDWKCKNYQYEVGKTYTHDGPVKACNSGFHACENPLDVLSYYDLTGSKFATVKLSGKLDRHPEDSKISSAKITIEAELSLSAFISAAVGWAVKNVAGKAKKGNYAKLASSGDSAQLASSGNSAQLASSGNYAQLASSGNYAQLASSGNSAKLASSGDSAQLASSGNSAQLASSGNYAQLASSGNYAQLASSGDSAKLASSGNYAQLASWGYSAQLASSGYSAKLASSGDYGVIAAAASNCAAKGADGTWIALAEFNTNGTCVGFATGCIGKDGLLADTFYKAMGGKLVLA